MGILFSPKRFFEEIGKTLQLAPVLVAIRWISTASFVTLPLLLFKVEPFVSPWLPIPVDGYYFWQIIFLLPYGVCITLLMSVSSLLILKGGGRLGTRFRAVFAVISYGLFLPWIPCLVWDLILIFSNNWKLICAAPFHFAAVVAETIIFAYGYRMVFGASKLRATAIAVINSLMFMVFSAILIR